MSVVGYKMPHHTDALQGVADGVIVGVQASAKLIGPPGQYTVRVNAYPIIKISWTPAKAKTARPGLTCEWFGMKTESYATMALALTAARELVRTVSLPSPLASGREQLVEAVETLDD